MNNNNNQQPVLEVRNLRKYFKVGTGKKKINVPAVDNISFDVYKKEVFGLVGESGCGKTTTGRTIIKLYSPTDGTIKLNGDLIGSGFFGNKYRISKARKQAKEQLLAITPWRQKNQKIKDDYNNLIDEKNKKTNVILSEINEFIDKYTTQINQIKTERTILKTRYRTDKDNEKYDCKLKISQVGSVSLQSYHEERNFALSIVKTRYLRMKSGINESAALSKEEKALRIVSIKDKYAEDIKTIHDDYQRKVNQYRDSKKVNNKLENRVKIKSITEKSKEKLEAIKTSYMNELEKTKTVNFLSLNISLISKKTSRFFVSFGNKAVIYWLLSAKTFRVAIQTFLTLFKFKENQCNKDEFAKIKNEYKRVVAIERQGIVESKKINNSKETDEKARNIQMIFQDPIASLNPRMTVREIISEGLVVQGIKDEDYISQKVNESLELVGLSTEYALRYPHEFSGGQRQRIGIARALILNPDFIIADEPISALDVSIRAQVLNLLNELKEKLDLTILFIAHDLSVVKYFCDRIAVMYAGKIVEMATSEELFKNPIHPYTKALFSSIPQPDPNYEGQRQRIMYDWQQHDYKTEKASLQEVYTNHFVYANASELSAYKQNLVLE